jgi:hypothetical protein
MTTTIKITELTNIGANLASSTVIPVVNMAGTPTTEKTVLGNIANVVLAGAGGNYVAAAKATTATTANTVLTNAQPNITSMGNLTGLTVSNVTGIVNFTTTANVTLGNVSNLHIAGGTAGQLLSTNGNGTLSWASDTTTYGNSNVVTLLSAFGSNTITTTGNVSVGNIIGNGQALTNIAGANVSGFVPNANIANTAYAVAGANVSGFVANANIANTAFSVAGANVSGFVANANVSNTAFAVAGANVSGFVANANVSNTAYAVAAANVSGLGNIATINLTGNSSNVLYGNGVFAAVAGGANTGNVTFNDVNIIGTGNLNLQPNSADAAAYVNIYLTGAADIHMAAGAAGANLILGTDEEANVAVLQGGNVAIQAGNVSGTKTWNFDTTGNLTLPTSGHVIVSGGIVGGGASPAPTLSGFSSVGALQFTNGNSNVTVNSNSNLWTFDSTGNLTIPGSSGGFIKTIANASIGVAAVDNGTNNPAQLISMTNAGAATSIISAYATNATIQTNATGTLKTWSFDNTGNLTAPGTVSATTFTGNGGGLSNVATKVTSSWTLASGVNTVSISVPGSGTYSIWVNGNIPNGIVTYTATAVVTNTNVPVLGEQYGWYYEAGNALVLTSIPNQFVGTQGVISNASPYSNNTANVFTFGITNNSGSTAVVNYGYTKL